MKWEFYALNGGVYIEFYHGTSDNINIGQVLLPPLYTGNLREDWRKKHLDSVFFTTSIMSANKFARKACDKYGGNPVVYIVKPIGYHLNINTNEYIANKAKIIKQLN